MGEIDAYIEKIVDRAPPLTAEQVAKLRVLIGLACDAPQALPVPTRATPLEPPRRYYEDGAQLVEVGRYSYRWTQSPPLMVGDHVVLPENWLSKIKEGPGGTPGTVTALGSTYAGEHSTIVRKL